jgi:hypothetical protein
MNRIKMNGFQVNKDGEYCKQCERSGETTE